MIPKSGQTPVLPPGPGAATSAQTPGALPAQAQATVRHFTASIVSQSTTGVAISVNGSLFEIDIPAEFRAAKSLSISVPKTDGTADSKPPAASAANSGPKPSLVAGMVVEIVEVDSVRLDKPVEVSLRSVTRAPVEIGTSTVIQPAMASLRGSDASIAIKIAIAPFDAGSQRPSSSAPSPSSASQQTNKIVTGDGSDRRARNDPFSVPFQRRTAEVSSKEAAAYREAARATARHFASPAASSAAKPMDKADGGQIPAKALNFGDREAGNNRLLMQVTSSQPDGKVILSNGPLDVAPRNPLAGLGLGSQVWVRPIIPNSQSSHNDSASLDRLLFQLMRPSGRHDGNSVKSIDARRLTENLVRTYTASRQAGDVDKPINFKINLDDFLVQRTTASDGERQQPGIRGDSLETVARPNDADAPVRPRELFPANFEARHDAGSEIEWQIERRHHDEEDRRRDEPETEVHRLSFKLSELGEINLELSVRGKTLHAILDCAGALPDHCRSEIADLFGAGAELANMHGQLIFRFSRPGVISA